MGIEPGPHWWETSALTTAPSLHPLKKMSELLFRPQRSGRGWSWGGAPLYWLAFCFMNFHTGITKQANDSTYIDEKIYDKGHLLPAMTYSFSEAYMRSTFTYTNAVPQISGFNRGQWAQYEKRIRQYATRECSPNGGDLYLITGISEVSLHCDGGGATQEIPLQELGAKTAPKVSIPRSMWTAGCCIAPSRGVLGAFAVIGNNVKDKKKVFISQVKMTKLQDFLLIGVKGFGGTDINLFPANPECSDPLKWVNLKSKFLPSMPKELCPTWGHFFFKHRLCHFFFKHRLSIAYSRASFLNLCKLF